jgi:uncharacterized protein (TIGR02757 family)
MEKWSEGRWLSTKHFLDEKAHEYERLEFMELDPVQIPHSFSVKEDIEISAFLVSILSWGQRKTIINKGKELMARMDQSPFVFVTGASESELKQLEGFVHRTFQHDDLLAFVAALRRIYQNGGLEKAMSDFIIEFGMQKGLSRFKISFFTENARTRSLKHLPDPISGSAAKRINMFLRWMVRSNTKEVDFGIWKSLRPAQLYLPLDVHTSNIARKLGLLERKQDDWRAVEELTEVLRKFDPHDPVKYDFALFGLGVNKYELPTFK